MNNEKRTPLSALVKKRNIVSLLHVPLGFISNCVLFPPPRLESLMILLVVYGVTTLYLSLCNEVGFHLKSWFS